MLWWLLAAAMMAALLFPIRFGMLRLFLVCGWLALWAGALCLQWRSRPVRIGVCAVGLVCATFLLGPGRTMNRRQLRSNYRMALLSYAGSPYVWGGECRRGIDCSGLVRRAMIDATLRRGLITVNPAGVRAALELWWFDSSAKAMGEEYRGRTRLLFPANSLNELDVSRLQVGDFAVTSSGVHTLAYIGGGKWIQADPGAGKVTVNATPSRNTWFHQPVNILRWRLLEE